MGNGATLRRQCSRPSSTLQSGPTRVGLDSQWKEILRGASIETIHGTRLRVFHTVRKPGGKSNLPPLKKKVATPGKLEKESVSVVLWTCREPNGGFRNSLLPGMDNVSSAPYPESNPIRSA